MEHVAGDLECALLEVIAERHDGNGRAFIGTDVAYTELTRVLRDRGASFTLYRSPPWYGLRDATTALESFGVVQVDPGVARYVPPGAPTPTADRLFLRTDEHRLKEALRRLGLVGPVRVEPERTLKSGSPAAGATVIVDVLCGREAVMVQESGSSALEALAKAFCQAARRRVAGPN